MPTHKAGYHKRDLRTGLQEKYLRKIEKEKKLKEELEFQKKMKNSLLFPPSSI